MTGADGGRVVTAATPARDPHIDGDWVSYFGLAITAETAGRKSQAQKIAAAVNDHVDGLLADPDVLVAATAQLRQQRDDAQAEVELLRRLVDSQLGECVGCNYTDGPDEYCPRHGRSYTDVLDVTERVISEARAERDAAVARADTAEADLRRVSRHCDTAITRANVAEVERDQARAERDRLAQQRAVVLDVCERFSNLYGRSEVGELLARGIRRALGGDGQ